MVITMNYGKRQRAAISRLQQCGLLKSEPSDGISLPIICICMCHFSLGPTHMDTDTDIFLKTLLFAFSLIHMKTALWVKTKLLKNQCMLILWFCECSKWARALIITLDDQVDTLWSVISCLETCLQFYFYTLVWRENMPYCSRIHPSDRTNHAAG